MVQLRIQGRIILARLEALVARQVLLLGSQPAVALVAPHCNHTTDVPLVVVHQDHPTGMAVEDPMLRAPKGAQVVVLAGEEINLMLPTHTLQLAVVQYAVLEITRETTL